MHLIILERKISFVHIDYVIGVVYSETVEREEQINKRLLIILELKGFISKKN